MCITFFEIQWQTFISYEICQEEGVTLTIFEKKYL